MLNKCHIAIFYCRVQEFQAAGKIRVGWILGERNPEDLLTKTTMDGNVTHFIVVFIFRNKASKWSTDKNEYGMLGWY